MYLDCKFGPSLSLNEITLLFDLSLYLDWTLAQRKARQKAKSKVKVAQCNQKNHNALLSRPRNQSSRPLTIDLRQISINSIDRLDFWPFSRLSSTQCHGDRLDRLDRLYTWFFVFA